MIINNKILVGEQDRTRRNGFNLTKFKFNKDRKILVVDRCSELISSVKSINNIDTFSEE